MIPTGTMAAILARKSRRGRGNACAMRLRGNPIRNPTGASKRTNGPPRPTTIANKMYPSAANMGLPFVHGDAFQVPAMRVTRSPHEDAFHLKSISYLRLSAFIPAILTSSSYSLSHASPASLLILYRIDPDVRNSWLTGAATVLPLVETKLTSPGANWSVLTAPKLRGTFTTPWM